MTNNNIVESIFRDDSRSFTGDIIVDNNQPSYIFREPLVITDPELPVARSGKRRGRPRKNGNAHE